MSNLYNHLNEKKFKILTIICCLFADLCAGIFVYMRMSNEKVFKESLQQSFDIVKQYNPQLQGLEMVSFYDELWQLFMTMLISLIFFGLIIHILIYTMHYYEKAFGHGYTKLYAWVGGFFMTLYAITNLLTFPEVLFIVPGGLLLFIGYSTKFFPFKNKEE